MPKDYVRRSSSSQSSSQAESSRLSRRSNVQRTTTTSSPYSVPRISSHISTANTPHTYNYLNGTPEGTAYQGDDFNSEFAFLLNQPSIGTLNITFRAPPSGPVTAYTQNFNLSSIFKNQKRPRASTDEVRSTNVFWLRDQLEVPMDQYLDSFLFPQILAQYEIRETQPPAAVTYTVNNVPGISIDALCAQTVKCDGGELLDSAICNGHRQMIFEVTLPGLSFYANIFNLTGLQSPSRGQILFNVAMLIRNNISKLQANLSRKPVLGYKLPENENTCWDVTEINLEQLKIFALYKNIGNKWVAIMGIPKSMQVARHTVGP